MKFFATTPKGLELLLVEELKSLGAETAAEKLAGVAFTGDLATAYKACLWSRLANRILMPLIQIPASTPEELYAGVQTIPWDEHMDPEGTLLINFVSSQSQITHTLFGAQKVKDAIVDQIRDKYDTRPSVARENPDLSINVYLHRDTATISLDLSGESLHKRGIRVEAGMAPLKENLAAAILIRSGWKKVLEAGGMLLDPMCGSGTFLIEAAQMAANIAPGLTREYFGFLNWKKHDAAIWEKLVAEANVSQKIENIPAIIGYDRDPNAITIAFANIERAGLLGKIHVEKCELTDCKPKKEYTTGLFVVNPPYGERLGNLHELKHDYETMGAKLKSDFFGWSAAVFTGNSDLAKNMGIRSRKQYALYNGAIPCQLLLFDVQKEWFINRSPEATNERRVRESQSAMNEADQQAVQMFVNRAQKNLKHLKRWAERENISSYRIYDADLPEYAVAIDRYEDCVTLKEYPAPKSVLKSTAEKRLQDVLAVLPEALNVPAKNIFLLENFFSPRTENLPVPKALSAIRDEVMAGSSSDDFSLKIPAGFHIIKESEAKFLINLKNEISDTGLNLQHRMLRKFIQTNVKDKNFLNVFSHAGAATVSAALGGARSTTSIEDSDAYIEWTKCNLALNQFYGAQHRCFYTDIMEWVETQRSRYDFIFIEVSEDAGRLKNEYSELIGALTRLLDTNGMLVLTSRHTKFKPDLSLLNGFLGEEITSRFIATDFPKESKLQRCWKITKSIPMDDRR